MKDVAIIGGGPAGLMAAEVIATAGVPVALYERRQTPGRKFLMAGRGGLNLTHSEDMPDFMRRYGNAAATLAPIIAEFSPLMLRAWCEGLREPTFVGTRGRVFPQSFKASPLLRAWRSRLDSLGVRFLLQHDWQGWADDSALIFSSPDGEVKAKPAATVLALGGASWPKLGADGNWTKIMAQKNIPVSPLLPANCGFAVEWSDVFRNKFAGSPLKQVTLSFADISVKGEVMITEKGLEGGIVYAVSALLRCEIMRKGSVTFTLDLKPDLSSTVLLARLQTPRAAKSFSNFLREKGGLSPAAVGLLQENRSAHDYTPEALTALIKAFPVYSTAPFSIDRAISTAGGIPFTALDDHLMLKDKPGVFAAGEMLDWEAPTGGYLLQGTFSTAVRAAKGALAWVGNSKSKM